MIYGTGIDLTEIDRVIKVQTQHPKFAKRVLTPKEQKSIKIFWCSCP